MEFCSRGPGSCIGRAFHGFILDEGINYGRIFPREIPNQFCTPHSFCEIFEPNNVWAIVSTITLGILLYWIVYLSTYCYYGNFYPVSVKHFSQSKKITRYKTFIYLLQATTAAGFIHLIIRQCFFPRLKSCDFSSVTKSAKQFIEKYISIYEQQSGVPIAKKN